MMNLYDLYKKYKNKYIRLKRIEVENNTDKSLYDERINTFNILIQSNIFNDNDCNILYEFKKEGNINSKRYKYVTKAGQGTIYFIFSDSYGIALKFIEMSSYYLEKNNIYNPIHKKWRELYILKQCTQLVQNKVTQNLPMLYDNRICKKNNNDMLLLYSELATGDLMSWLKKEHDSKDWKDMLFQIWHSLYVLQEKINIVHNDLRLGNILYFNNKYKNNCKYTMNNDNFYLDKPKYIFMIWDFGSSELLHSSGQFKNAVKNKIDANSDLHFIHDLYKRLRVLALTNRYTIDELEEFLNKNMTDAEYIKKTKDENKRKFSDGRFAEKYCISLAYYIIETDRFDQLYKERKDSVLKGHDKVYLPPIDIDNILKTLSEKYNYKYEEALNKYGPKSRKIPNPKKLIEIFLPEYKNEINYDLEFIC